MSNKQTSAIESVTLNTATFTEETFTPTCINFFYGKNGAGKTSLGRQLGACEGIRWAEGESASDYEILLYNQDFIDAHFRLLDNLKGIFTIREGGAEETERQIAALEARRKELEKRLLELSKEREATLDALDAADKNFEAACLRNTRSLREKFKQAFRNASRNPALAREISAATPKDCDEAELERRYAAAFSSDTRMYPLLNPLDVTAHIEAVPDCPLLADPLHPSSGTAYAHLVREMENLWWIEKGHTDFQEKAGGLCPYCQQPLPPDFEAHFASCYDEDYLQKRQEIEAFPESLYVPHGRGLQDHRRRSPGRFSPFRQRKKLRMLKTLSESFLRAMRGALTKISEKLQNPAASVALEDLTPLLREINDVIISCNDEIEQNNRFVTELEKNRKNCIRDVWALAAFRLQGEAETLQKAQIHALETNDAIAEEASNASKEHVDIRQKLDELGSATTTVQAAVDAMNRILRDSGFEGFEIVRSEFAKDAYMVVRDDKKIAARLSEGEQHFLSFLYFYHLVKGCDASGVQRKKIVIIDDPVSSLDGTNLFIISSLVREMIEVCYNNADYRGQTVKGDYIRQIFILTHNAQFHKGITCSQVSRFNCVNFYKINKAGNRSSIHWCKRPSRTAAGEEENYNPVKNAYAALWAKYLEVQNEIPLMNVIRRILDFYFLELCARDGLDLREEILIKQRDRFVTIREDGTEDRTLFQLADSMLQYMGAGVYGDMTFVSDGSDTQEIRNTFEMIFRRLGYGAHYDMMLERARLA